MARQVIGKDDNKTIIRYYRPEDLDLIRSMFAASFLHWLDAPYHVAGRRFSTHAAVANFLFIFLTASQAISLSFKSELDTQRTIIDVVYCLWCAASLAVITMSGLASAYFYFHRRTVQGMFRKHVKDALENDLKDPVGAYGLRRSDDLPGFEPTGPAGFWIAEYGGEIIGFVTLNLAGDSTTGDVGRLVVSPAHRRRGVAGILMNTVIAHARTNRLRVLKLLTSDFHDAATAMYARKGWVVEKKMAYPGYSNWWRFIIVFRKDLV